MRLNKAALAGFCAILAVMLSSCTVLSRVLIPQKVETGGVEYRTGFYGALWPQNLKREGDPFTVRGIEYYHIENDRFDWVHSDAGSDACGVLYCNDSQWADAEAYYGDPDNYIFYCQVETNRLQSIEIEDFDPEIFDQLSAFAAQNDYDPFDNGHNQKVETLRLPIPDFHTNPSLVFYKASTDGYFESYKGYKFHIIDGHLYFLFYYDYGHGEYEEMRCTAVPDEIGRYIVGLSEEYHFYD